MNITDHSNFGDIVLGLRFHSSMALAQRLAFFAMGLTFVGLNSAQALVIEAQGVPMDYTVYTWDYVKNQNRKADYKSEALRGRRLRFDIPDEFIVRDEKTRTIKLWQSLEKWRNGTPVGPAYPKTVNGNGTFPFTENYGEEKDHRFPEVARHIALMHMLANKKQYPNLMFSAKDRSRVSMRVPGVLAQLDNIPLDSELNCRSKSDQPAVCMVCNCANEAGIEKHAGKVGVNRTVLTRVKRITYPDTICDVIWFKNDSGTPAFSWINGGDYMSHKTLKGDMLKQCIEASKESVVKGPWQWDMFYNPDEVTPGWASEFAERGEQTIQRHRYMNSGYSERPNGNDLLKSEISGTEGDDVIW